MQAVTMRAALVAPVLAAAGMAATAQQADAPRTGLVYNTVERSSISYDCSRTSPTQLDCSFVQTAVRPASTMEELPKKMAQAREQFRRNPAPLSAEECATYRQVVDIFEGRSTAPDPTGLSKLTPVEKADGLKAAKLGVGLCAKHSEEGLMEAVRQGEERARRTCKVSSTQFRQTYRLASEFKANTPVWVAQAAPAGLCASVDLSRFEQATGQTGAFKFWTYTARKAITNPSAEFFPGSSCSLLDEKPYLYDWKSKEHQLSCDYIEFSPI
jgi:hypothetical protein